MNKEDAYNSTYKYNMLFNTIPENNEADDDAKFNTNLISDIDLQNFDPKRHEYYTNLLNIYNNDPDTLKKLLNKYNSVKSFKEKEREIIRKVNNYINIIQSGGDSGDSGDSGGVFVGGSDGELEKIEKDCDKMIKTTGDLLNDSADILLATADDNKSTIKNAVEELITLSKISSGDLSGSPGSPYSPSSQSSSGFSTPRELGRPGLWREGPVPLGPPVPPGPPGRRPQQYDEKALVKAITDFTNISKKLLNPSVLASTPDSVIIAVETSKRIVKLLQDKQIKSPEVSDALGSAINIATKLKLADAETKLKIADAETILAEAGKDALSSAIAVSGTVSNGLAVQAPENIQEAEEALTIAIKTFATKIGQHLLKGNRQLLHSPDTITNVIDNAKDIAKILQKVTNPSVIVQDSLSQAINIAAKLKLVDDKTNVETVANKALLSAIAVTGAVTGAVSKSLSHSQEKSTEMEALTKALKSFAKIGDKLSTGKLQAPPELITNAIDVAKNIARTLAKTQTATKSGIFSKSISVAISIAKKLDEDNKRDLMIAEKAEKALSSAIRLSVNVATSFQDTLLEIARRDIKKIDDEYNKALAEFYKNNLRGNKEEVQKNIDDALQKAKDDSDKLYARMLKLTTDFTKANYNELDPTKKQAINKKIVDANQATDEANKNKGKYLILKAPVYGTNSTPTRDELQPAWTNKMSAFSHLKTVPLTLNPWNKEFYKPFSGDELRSRELKREKIVAEYAKKASDLRKKADDAKKAYDNAVTKAIESQGELTEKAQKNIVELKEKLEKANTRLEALKAEAEKEVLETEAEKEATLADTLESVEDTDRKKKANDNKKEVEKKKEILLGIIEKLQLSTPASSSSPSSSSSSSSSTSSTSPSLLQSVPLEDTRDILTKLANSLCELIDSKLSIYEYDIKKVTKSFSKAIISFEVAVELLKKVAYELNKSPSKTVGGTPGTANTAEGANTANTANTAEGAEGATGTGNSAYSRIIAKLTKSGKDNKYKELIELMLTKRKENVYTQPSNTDSPLELKKNIEELAKKAQRLADEAPELLKIILAYLKDTSSIKKQIDMGLNDVNIADKKRRKDETDKKKKELEDAEKEKDRIEGEKTKEERKITTESPEINTEKEKKEMDVAEKEANDIEDKADAADVSFDIARLLRFTLDKEDERIVKESMSGGAGAGADPIDKYSDDSLKTQYIETQRYDKIDNNIINEFRKLKAEKDSGSGNGSSNGSEGLGRIKTDNKIEQLSNDIDVYNASSFEDKENNRQYITRRIDAFENDPENPIEELALTFDDRIVFIVATFFIRYVTIIMIQWCIDINIIKTFYEGFIYYAVIYIILFWFVVLFINIDNSYEVKYMNFNGVINSIRTLFYYFYMGTNGISRLLIHTSLIIILIVIPIILNIKKKQELTTDDSSPQDDNMKVLNYEERKQLTKALSLFTMFIWLFTSIIATKF